MPESITVQSAREVLSEVFGHEDFRPAQQAVLGDILDGNDSIVVMPTGSGKSILYQVPALLRTGTAIVISPLISLMQDQVSALREHNVAAAYLNSTLSTEERHNVLQAIRDQQLDLVYVAPERLRDRRFLQEIGSTSIPLLIVDEAHCVSQWGHDFRPDYLRIQDLRASLPGVQTLAVTATATARVRADIAEQLGLDDPVMHVAGFDRPNLQLEVVNVRGEKEKLAELKDAINTFGTPGIVYAATRKHVESVSKSLRKLRLTAGKYHGGLDDTVRHKAQTKFMSGQLDVIAATNAFGMGIDKANIRFVLHWDIPGSIEAYYQEVGRAGRDGEPSLCRLCFQPGDLRVQEFFIEETYPDPAAYREMLQLLSDYRADERAVQITADALADGMHNLKTGMGAASCLNLLERSGMILKDRTGSGMAIQLNASEAAVARLGEEMKHAEMRRSDEEDRLKQMVRYGWHKGCRRYWILDYFGEEHEQHRCDACDNCTGSTASEERVATDEEWSAVRKILSGVGRTKGYIGREKILLMLRGSQANGIAGSWLEDLPTYAALKHVARDYIDPLFDACVSVGWIDITLKDGKYPICGLSESGREAVQSDTPLPMPLSLSGPLSGSGSTGKIDPGSLTGSDSDLYEHLRNLRNHIASKSGGPAYSVFNNAALADMAARRPTNKDEMLEVKGVGPAKWKKYGKRFIAAIKEWSQG